MRHAAILCGVEAALRGADAIRTAKWSEVPASINIERSVIFNVAEDAKSVTGTMFWLGWRRRRAAPPPPPPKKPPDAA